MAFGNGRFAAVGTYNGMAAPSAYSSGSPYRLAIDWFSGNLPYNDWRKVIYANGLFVAIAANSSAAATSTDGETWTQRSLPFSADWRSLTYGAGKFVAIPYNNASFATSTDGITWTQRSFASGQQDNWASIAFSG